MYKNNLVFGAACISLFLFGITLITLGSILPEVTKQFGLDGLNTGSLVSVLPAGILTGSLIFGPVVDRYGFKRVLIISIFISAISLEGLAFTKSLSVLFICVYFIGFGGGIINGGTSALVADISGENKGAKLSLLGVFFGLGALGMPLLLGILSGFFEYRNILAAVGIFMFLPAIWIIFIRFPLPKQAQGFPLKEGVKLLKEPAILLTGFFLFFQSGVEGIVNNWTTTFLQDELKTSREAALYALSFSVVGLTIMRILTGFILNKFTSYAVLITSMIAVIAGGIVLKSTTSYPVAFGALILTGMGLSAGFPLVLGYVGQLYQQLSGTAFSIVFVIALAGNIIINYIFGLIAHRYSIAWQPLMIIGCAVAMIFLLLMIRRVIRDKVRL